MKHYWIIIALISIFKSYGQTHSSREHICLNFDWQFKAGEPESKTDWKTIQLPHDASIGGIFSKDNSTTANGWLPYGKGTYRKKFICPENKKDKLVFIQFDGVYRNAKVWINGKLLGTQLNGYLGFEYDLSANIKFGQENWIEVFYDNTKQGTSRWYTGEGIYRDVWLKYVNKLSIPLYGTYITTPKVTQKLADVVVETEIRNRYSESKNVFLITEIFDKHGIVQSVSKAAAPVPADEVYTFHQEIELHNPLLWDTEEPNLYKAKSTVIIENKTVDEYETSFGVREIKFSSERGLLLNGKKVIAVGGNLHHDLGCLGSAALERGYERRLQLLKNMGCNSVRLSHNPHSPLLLDLCDKMGILIIDEAYDKWTSQYYGESMSFMEGSIKDIETFVKRDRNHPSIYVWSVGNEVDSQFGKFDAKFETQADNPDYGVSRFRYLKSLVKKYDPSRYVTAAFFPSRNAGWFVEWEHWKDHDKFLQSTPPPMAFYMDVVSWNYTENLFEIDHKNYPQMTFIATETATNIRFGNRKISWFEIDTSYVAGHYYWSASDYLGEANWPTKTWARAFYDLSDEQTSIGYMYQSFYSKKPMVHIMVYEQDTFLLNRWNRVYNNDRWCWYPSADHWNWEKFKTVTLSTFTNCEEVELFINEKSQGRKLLKDFKDSIVSWQVSFEKGKIKAVGINRGKSVCEHELKTAQSPYKIVLEPDRDMIQANGLDLSYIKVKIVDKNGVTVPDKDLLINFSVKGGDFAGSCNGDTYSDESYLSDKRSTYHGKCLLVVRSQQQESEILVTAKAKGLEDGKCLIKSVSQK